MPNIEQFNAGSGEVAIPDRGAEAFAQAGRRVGIAYTQVGEDIDRTIRPLGQEAIQHHEDMDISNTYSSLGQAEVQAKQALDVLESQPDAADHPERGQQFLDQYTQQLQTIADSASTHQGRTMAARMITQFRDNMADRVAGGQADLAGAKWMQNATQYRAALADDTAAHPEDADKNRGIWQNFVQTTIPTMPAAQRARIMTEFAQPGLEDITSSGYLAAIERGKQQLAANGKDAPALDQVEQDITAQRGFEYLSPQMRDTLAERVDTARRQGQELFVAGTKLGQQQWAVTAKTRLAQINAGLSDMIANPDSFSQDKLNDLEAARSQILNDPNAGLVTGELSHTDELIRTLAHGQETGEYVQTQPSVISSYLSRAMIPPGAPGAVTDAELAKAVMIDHTVNRRDYGMLKASIDHIRSDPGYKAAFSRFQQWQKQGMAAILGANGAGATVDQREIAQQFAVDSFNFFSQDVQALKDPMKAADAVANQNNAHHFPLDVYLRAAQGGATVHDLISQPGYQRWHGGVGSGPSVAPAAAAAAAPATWSDDQLAAIAGGHR